MKKFCLLQLILFAVAIGCNTQRKAAQSGVYDNDIINLVNSRKISENVDSLVNNKFDQIREQLQTPKSQDEIEKLIIGNWTGKTRSRSNGRVLWEIERSIFGFSSNSSFFEINEGDTLTGTYKVQKDSNNNLVLIYDELQYPPFPKEMLDRMTEEELERVSFRERSFNIFEINERRLVFYSVIPLIDYSNPELITHSTLMLEKYEKD